MPDPPNSKPPPLRSQWMIGCLMISFVLFGIVSWLILPCFSLIHWNKMEKSMQSLKKHHYEALHDDPQYREMRGNVQDLRTCGLISGGVSVVFAIIAFLTYQTTVRREKYYLL